MSPDPDLDRVGLGADLAAAAVFGLAVLCCAGPALLAAGALGALGGWLADPWLIGAAVVLIAAAVARALRRRTTHTPDAGEDGEDGGAGPGSPLEPRPVDAAPTPIQHQER